MDAIIDLTDEGNREILHTTAAGGLLGGRLLHGEPLESYLETDEVPAYVLRNKKSGLQIRGQSESESYEPDDGYQALALVTDVRVLVVVGGEGGDETFSLGLDEVVQTGSERGGFRTHVLTIETVSEETWQFPCSSDPTTVAEHIDGTAQAWANAERLLDDVEAQFGRAREQLRDGNHEDAIDSVEGTRTTIRQARERAKSVGTIVSRQIDERANTLESQMGEIRRHSHAQGGAQAHARAQNAWENAEYVQAAAAYDTAVTAYERALERNGSTPDDETLRRRIRGAAGERELLRAGPLVDADAARRRAQAIDHAQDAASEWETALESYRDLLGLEWGSDEQSFLGNRDQIQQRAEAVADDAIDDHHRAAEQWLHAGDKLAADGQREQAIQAYEQAQDQLERARELAREVRPERVDDIDDTTSAVTGRLDGDLPAEKPKDEPVSAAEMDYPLVDIEEPEPEPESPADRRNLSETDQEDHGREADAEKSQNQQGLLQHVQTLDEQRFTTLVADIWEAQGWSTTVFSATTDVVYDIVAIGHEPTESRMLLWTVHADGGVVDVTTVERCATARDSSKGADEATLVTTGTLTQKARSRAEALDVSVIEADRLVEILREEGLEDHLLKLARTA